MAKAPVKIMSILSTCLLNACCRRPKTTVMVVVLFLLLYLLLTRIKLDDDEHIETVEEWENRMEAERVMRLRKHIAYYVRPKDLQPLPPSWMDKGKCPACFGVDMCDAFEKNEVVVEIPEVETAASRKGVYFGSWKEIPVAIKRLSSELYPKEFKSFDRFVCKNMTGSESCNVSATILSESGYVQQGKAFNPSFLHEAWKISYSEGGPISLPYSLCVSDDLILEFAKLYGGRDDSTPSNLTAEQRAILFTSMVVQPESLLLKFMSDKQFHKISPRIHGACGRLIVVEHGGVLLEHYLNESFTERAEFALQLLGLVNILWHTDPTWFALYKEFEYENIAVSYDREIYLIDYEELILIQSSKDESEDHEAYLNEKMCNEDCFDNLWRNLSNPRLSFSERQSQCHLLHAVSSAYMYSTLCRNILSDLKEHREVADKHGKVHRGLLHSIPSSGEKGETESLINSALKECVHETTRGGREAAINKLSEILFSYMKHIG